MSNVEKIVAHVNVHFDKIITYNAVSKPEIIGDCYRFRIANGYTIETPKEYTVIKHFPRKGI